MKRSNLDQPLWLEVQSFLADCMARNLSPCTVKIYTCALAAFQRWVPVDAPEQVTPNHLRSYLMFMEVRGHNPGGRHQAYRVLKTFFRWLVAEGIIERSPLERVRPPKLPDAPLEPVSVADVQAMLATCDRSFTGQRDRAILLTLLDTGLRAVEFLSLELADIDLVSGAMLVRRGKGGKKRTVFVGARTKRELLRYLRMRGQPESGPLWVNRRTGGRLAYEGLRQIVRRRAAMAGVAEPSLHSFRRAFALLALRNGIDVYSLQRLMGHADLTVLRRYLAQTESDLRQAHHRTSPVDHLTVDHLT